jgi:hypothetical protein
MKTIATFILIFSISFLQAQTNAATPNASFHYWTHITSNGGYNDPNQWQCLNPTLETLGYTSCLKDSINPLPGCKYAAQLITQDVIIQEAPGALTTGTINTTNQTINGGIPYTFRPDSMIGYYMYTSEKGDNGDCEFYLFGATHADTIGQAFFKTPTSTVSTWTRFALAITYKSMATPDTSLWIFSSSLSGTSAQTGSQLYIDSLGLVFDTNSKSAINTINNSDLISIAPNPTSGSISIRNSSNSKGLIFNLYDITGRKVEENELAAGTNNMELEGIAVGLYIYSIQDAQNAVIKTGKIVVQK